MTGRPPHRAPVRATAAAFLGACHPLPTVAVTALSAGLAALAGTPAGTGTVLVLAVLAGQLSIGWSNDAIDAGRDAAAGRTDKPAARGVVSRTGLAVAATVAAVVSLALSAVLGVSAGAAAFAVVVCGWAYNSGLKATVVSVVPYAVAFGLLPAAATLAAPGGQWPQWWVVTCGALLGVTAHIANVLPDLRTDREQRIAGLPQRLGPTADTITVPALLTAITCLVLFAPGGIATAVSLPVIVVAALAATAATVHGLRRPGSPWFFRGVIVVAVADVVLFAALGQSLT